MTITRRTLLTLGVGAVAGCATSSGIPTSTQTEPSPPPAVPPKPPPALQPPPSPTLAADPKAVARKHAHQRPREWGLDVPGVVTKTSLPTIALTFDACGGPHGSGYDKALIAELRRTKTKATLFLNKNWIKTNPAIAEQLIADDLFEIANHGSRHLPLSVNGRAAYGISGTKSAAEAVDEVWDNHEFLTKLVGKPPRFFRSGTAHYDDVCVQIVKELGETPVNFSINGDAGATASQTAIVQAVSRAKANDIVIAHMNQPRGSTAEGFTRALAKVRDSGIQFGHLRNK